MNSELQQTLSNLYQSSTSLVLLMNLSWEILWSNKPHDGITDLPAQLGISRNHVDNTTHRLMLGGVKHECRLLCNLQEGFRIAELSPCKEELQLDYTELSTAMQAVSSACSALNNILKENDDLGQYRLMLNAIMGSCYRIYRSAFLHKLIDRMQNGTRTNDNFCVQVALNDAYEQIRHILKSRMDIRMQCPASHLYLQGDPDELTSALLAATVLCCKENEHHQVLEIGLTQTGRNAVLTLRSEITNIPLERENKKISDISAGDYAAENAILNLFCGIYQGSWMLQENSAEGIRICTISFPASDHSNGSITLRSTQEKANSDFFGKYKVMLSCIHYMDRF